MLASLLLVAIFSCASPFGAEAHHLPPRCDPDIFAIIYDYWAQTDGYPSHITEHNIKCHEREVALLSTQAYFDDDVECALIHHRATYHSIYTVDTENVTSLYQSAVYEHHGELVELISQTVRVDIADSNNVRCTYKCSYHVNAKEGDSQFMIKGDEDEWTEEGVEEMKAVLESLFSVNTTCLRTYEEGCGFPNDDQPETEHCEGSCTE